MTIYADITHDYNGHRPTTVTTFARTSLLPLPQQRPTLHSRTQSPRSQDQVYYRSHNNDPHYIHALSTSSRARRIKYGVWPRGAKPPKSRRAPAIAPPVVSRTNPREHRGHRSTVPLCPRDVYFRVDGHQKRCGLSRAPTRDQAHSLPTRSRSLGRPATATTAVPPL